MVKLLLDTHALLWTLLDDARLSDTAKAAILNPGNEVFVSVVSAWEMAIKKGLGKLQVPDELEKEVKDCGFYTLSMSFTHAESVALLPHHHRDPFDRMLVVQAMKDRLTIVTADDVIPKYDVPTLW